MSRLSPLTEVTPLTSEPVLLMTSSNPTSDAGDQSAAVPVSFNFQLRTRVVFGCGEFERLGSLVKEINGSRVLLVTDAGLKDAGHCAHAVALMTDAGLTVFTYDHVTPNPTTDDVDECVAFAADRQIDVIVGLGGGSSMDCAKGTNFLLTNGGRMHDYRGVGRATKPMLPMIAVPTTCGTGSEAQSFAVIADAKTHMKMPCGDAKAACRIAILDPELTTTMPRSVAAATGVDAMTHAIESYVTLRRTPVSRMLSREAWALLSKSFETSLASPRNLTARGNMQWGSHLAGAAIENSMLGAAHASANPITAHFDITHGVAVGLLMPHVIRWNNEFVDDSWRELVVAAGWEAELSSDNAADVLANGLTRLLQAANQPTTITEAIGGNCEPELLQTLATEASEQWTGTFNPRPMDAESFLEIYRKAI